MREEIVKIYTFDELSEDVQKKIIEAERATLWSEGLNNDLITEHLQEELDYLGFKGDFDISWSLAYCQGDGVSFTGRIKEDTIKEVFDKTVLISDKMKELYERAVNRGWTIETELTRSSSSYVHAYTVSTDNFYDNSDDVVDMAYDLDVLVSDVEELFDTLEREVENYRLEVCKELEKLGYADIEYYESDERISDDLINNNCEYYEDGRPV